MITPTLENGQADVAMSVACDAAAESAYRTDPTVRTSAFADHQLTGTMRQFHRRLSSYRIPAFWFHTILKNVSKKHHHKVLFRLIFYPWQIEFGISRSLNNGRTGCLDWRSGNATGPQTNARAVPLIEITQVNRYNGLFFILSLPGTTPKRSRWKTDNGWIQFSSESSVACRQFVVCALQEGWDCYHTWTQASTLTFHCWF